jgi:hypothetical protein
VDDPEELKTRIPDTKKEIISSFEVWHSSHFNMVYFQIDTNSLYLFINAE